SAIISTRTGRLGKLNTHAAITIHFSLKTKDCINKVNRCFDKRKLFLSINATNITTGDISCSSNELKKISWSNSIHSSKVDEKSLHSRSSTNATSTTLSSFTRSDVDILSFLVTF